MEVAAIISLIIIVATLLNRISISFHMLTERLRTTDTMSYIILRLDTPGKPSEISIEAYPYILDEYEENQPLHAATLNIKLKRARSLYDLFNKNPELEPGKSWIRVKTESGPFQNMRYVWEERE